MPGVLDQSISVGKETTYGTAVATTRGYEAMGDGFEREVEFVEDEAVIRNREGMLANRRRIVSKGATGSLEHCLLTGGEGLLLSECFGNAVAPAAAPSIESTAPDNAKVQKFNTTDAGPVGSFTVQVVRQLIDVSHAMSVETFDYSGGIITSWTISVEVDGKVMFTPTFDFQKEALNATDPSSNVVYQHNRDFFLWEDCTISIGGNKLPEFRSFELEVDLGYDTERYFLQGASEKSKPVRVKPIAVSGSLEGELRALTQYNAFVAGTTQPLVFECKHPTPIETKSSKDWFASLQITVPLIQYDGSTPQLQLDGLSTIELPFKGLQKNTADLTTAANSMVLAEYTSLDTAA